MKIIISHDIDHLSVREHIFRDFIIPKYLFWSFLELIKRKISLKIFFKKIIGLFKKGAWNNLEDLFNFNQEKGVKPTIFIAVNKGKGLNYSKKKAKEAINLTKKYNFDIGLHGICYEDFDGIKKEREAFKEMSNLEDFGVRMHYLRTNEETLKNLSKAGYLFDTSILSEELEQEYKIGAMTEVPFHIMDSYLLGPRSSFNLDGAINYTFDLLNKAEKEGKKYFAVLFHNNYFSDEFPQFKSWYIWLIDYCSKRYEFINYRDLL